MFQMRFVCVALLLISSSVAEGPVSGVYYDSSAAEAWFCQLTLDSVNKLAKFEFILNSAGTKAANLPFPKYFKLEQLAYTWTEESKKLSFLNSDLDNPLVLEMIDFFAPLGQFPVPVVTVVNSDGAIVANIMLVSAEMTLGEGLDFEKKMTELDPLWTPQAPNGTSQKNPSGTSSPPSPYSTNQAAATTKSASCFRTLAVLLLGVLCLA